MTISDNHKPGITGMIIVRRYEAADEGDLSARMRLVFAMWMENLYNGDGITSDEMKEDWDEQRRSLDPSIDDQAIRRD